MSPFSSNNKSSTNAIREVFDYINRFKDQIFVLKIEDDLLETPLFSLLIRDIVLISNMGIKVVLIPGARHSIDKVLKAYNIESRSRNNIRITGADAISLVKLGASNVSNHILTLLSENGATGVMGNWVRAIEMGVLDGVDYEQTGKIESINVKVLKRLLEDHQIPILSNIGWSAVGKSYNISSNALALAVAQELGASKLFFIGRLGGIREIPGCRIPGLEVRETGVYSNLDAENARQLLSLHRGDLPFEEAELVEMAILACQSGVNRFHIIDGGRDGILLQEIFSTSGQGTMFYANVYANIRPARTEDIPGILHIMQPYVEEGKLIQRHNEDIGKHLETFFVYAVDDSLHGCGSLKLWEGDMAEIEAVVVDGQYNRKGTGKKIISYLLTKAKKAGKKKVFILTTQASDFFMRVGFKIEGREILPEEKRKLYNENRNSKVMTIDL